MSIKSVVKTSAGYAKIKWSELYYADGYCVSRSTSKNGTYKRIAVVDYDKTDNMSYVDKTVNKGKTYYYKVRGYMEYNYGSGVVNDMSAGYSKYANPVAIKIE